MTLLTIRKSVLILLAVWCIAPLATDVNAARQHEDDPNILFIYLDDFGWRDAGFMGSDFYETPNIDGLAKGAMVFTNAYSCCANCAPARASLLSGQYSPRHRIFNVGTRPRGKAKDRQLEHIAGTDTLDPAMTTWAKMLQLDGYRTATIGKWHLSANPIPYGFDVNIAGDHRGSPPKGYYPPHPNAKGIENAPEDEYLTDRLSSEAVQFIRENADRKWCLYLTHFAVHTPIQARKDLLEKYENKPTGKLHQNPKMATMIESVDQGVGKIVQTLRDLKLFDKTMIVFSSDNGGHGPVTDMAPLRGYKGTFYEGGIRVPFFVHWPGKIKPSRNETPITGVDIFPTFCDVAQLEYPDQPRDGISLLPLLTQPASNPNNERSLFWHFPCYLQTSGKNTSEQRDPIFRTRPCSVVRKGTWKLIHYYEDDGYELYDLASDIGESQNLAQSQPGKREELKAELAHWLSSTEAPIPRHK